MSETDLNKICNITNLRGEVYKINGNIEKSKSYYNKERYKPIVLNGDNK